jgi:hypothetical protein
MNDNPVTIAYPITTGSDEPNIDPLAQPRQPPMTMARSFRYFGQDPERAHPPHPAVLLFSSMVGSSGHHGIAASGYGCTSRYWCSFGPRLTSDPPS